MKRRHHLARELAREGFLVIFDCSNTGETVKEGLEEIFPNLFLFSGAFDSLCFLPNLLVWTFPYNYEYAQRLPAPSGMIYDYGDDSSTLSNPKSLLARKHRRAIREADLVVAGTRKQAEAIRAIRADVLYLPDAVEENNWRAGVETALAAFATRQAGVDPASPVGEVMRRCISFWRPSQRRLFAAAAKRLIPFRDDACLEMYLEFGMSTNRRGRELVRRLGPYIDLSGKRHLDVGAAYTGFSAAFTEAGAHSEALEIDPELIEIARANLKDLAMDVPIHHADVTNQAEIDPFVGHFDIITCNDVIEHVLNAPAMLANVRRMLRPGGVAYFEIPNGDYAGFVWEDGHYLQFGITLLERPEAEVFYEGIRPGMPYRMGSYYSLEEYFRMMETAGLRPVLIEEQTTPEDWERTEAALVRLRAEGASRLATVPEVLRSRVAEAVARYLSRVEGMPRNTPEEQRRFLLRYGTAFWRILAYRAGGLSPSESKPSSLP